MSTPGERAHAALNVLTKWRVLFTGWQLGTRAKGDRAAPNDPARRVIIVG